MSVSNSENAALYNPKMHRARLTTGAQTLAAALTLTADSPDIIELDPGGASRNITLPADAVDLRGRLFCFHNSADAAENLVLKQSDGSTTVLTIGQAGTAIVWLGQTIAGTYLWRGVLSA